MNIILTALMPIILLLILGNVCRRTGFLTNDFWAASDKLTYFVLFPALLTTKVSQVDLSAINFPQLFTFILLYFSLNSALVWGIYKATKAKPNQFSSLYQSILRFNSYIYFAIIESVWGSNTLIISALVASVCVPIINICCIASFTVDSGQFSVKKILLPIIKNPIIIASLLGLIANIFPYLLPTVLFNAASILSKAALPLALLSVGAAVQIKMLLTRHDEFSLASLWLSTLVRLIISPVIALLITRLFNIDNELSTILTLFAAVPTATSSYILAKQLKGDANLMATMISLQTILSVFSLSLWLSLLT
ncbi:MAG: AEC family transporter [Ostreibacterium sp.]